MKKHILIDGTPISRQIDGLTQYILNVVLRLDTSAYNYTLLLRPSQCQENYLRRLQATNIRIEEVNISPIGPIRDFQFARYLKARHTLMQLLFRVINIHLHCAFLQFL